MENDLNTMSPIQPVPNPENSFIKKNFTPKFIAVIMGLLIIGGAAYGYATYLAKKNFDEVTRLAEEGRKQEEELRQKRLDSTSVANWQTYRNEKYEFEVKYPAEWRVLTETGDSALFSKPQNQPIPSLIVQLGSYGADFEIQSFATYPGEDIFSALRRIRGYDHSFWSHSEFLLSGSKAVYFEDDDENALTSYYEVVSINNGRLYSFVPAPDRTFFNQILSTFKFTPTP